VFARALSTIRDFRKHVRCRAVANRFVARPSTSLAYRQQMKRETRQQNPHFCPISASFLDRARPVRSFFTPLSVGPRWRA
jgi:hypothetical protein